MSRKNPKLHGPERKFHHLFPARRHSATKRGLNLTNQTVLVDCSKNETEREGEERARKPVSASNTIGIGIGIGVYVYAFTYAQRGEKLNCVENHYDAP